VNVASIEASRAAPMYAVYAARVNFTRTRYVTGTRLLVDGGTAAASGWIRQPDGDGWGLYGKPGG
jgi:hypothetical protein